ncbi:MAG TPA: S-layer homology domain-containing protein [Acidimicrobiales bacterium]|nr:S-layer homology domain-containing protein [Acidimicrobiales bacterium]
MRFRTPITTLATLLAIGMLPVIGGAATNLGGSASEPIPTTVSERVDGLPAAYGAAATGGTSDGTQRSAPFEAPLAFSMVALELPATATANLRTSLDGSTWSTWEEVEAMGADDLPDPGSAEAAASVDPELHSEPVWVGEARWLQVAVAGAALADVAATFIDSNGLTTGTYRTSSATPTDDEYQAAATDDTTTTSSTTTSTTTTTAQPLPSYSYPADPSTGRPEITSRSEWGADESLRKGSPSYASSARYAVVHHTAGGNSYSASDAPAVVRGIYHYHTQSLGWNDIGYNLLVDRFGRIYEGRAGGLDYAVIGAHAQGFNTGSIGIAVMGEFDTTAPSEAALDAVADTLAWKFRHHSIDPRKTVMVVSGGSNKYDKGEEVELHTITSHRNVGHTECPGDAYYAELPTLRAAVVERWEALPEQPPADSEPPPDDSGTSASTPSSFTDIEGNVHAESIDRIAAAGVTSGCTIDRYCPDAPVTRGQTVTFLGRALGLEEGTGQRFSDVPTGNIHAGYIAAAVDAKIIYGYPDGTFRPDDPLSREQMASVLRRAMGLDHVWGSMFSDVAFESPHRSSINAIATAGVTSGCAPDLYCPADIVSRAQMATFLTRAILDR